MIMSPSMPTDPQPPGDYRSPSRWRQRNESVVIVGRRRLPGRVLLISTVVVWVGFIVTLVIVLMLWHTPPMHPIELPR